MHPTCIQSQGIPRLISSPAHNLHSHPVDLAECGYTNVWQSINIQTVLIYTAAWIIFHLLASKNLFSVHLHKRVCS